MKKKEINNYGINLTMLWIWFWFMKLFAFTDSKKTSEAIQSHIKEAFKKVMGKINLICKNYIQIRRDLIVDAYVNKQLNNRITDLIEPKSNPDSEKVESIIKQKMAMQEHQRNKQEKEAEKKRKENDSAILLSYENELIDFVNSIISKSNSYIHGYMRKIQRKNPDIIADITNPFDDFSFDINNYHIRLEDK